MGDGSGFVTVSCAGHHEALVSGLWRTATDKRLLDTEVGWSSRTVRVHRLVADVFLSSDRLPDDCRTDESIRQHVLDSLLEFLYRGTVTVRREQLESLLDVAMRLGFDMLVEAIAAIGILSYTDMSDTQSDRPAKQASVTALPNAESEIAGLADYSNTGKRIRQSTRQSTANKLSQSRFKKKNMLSRSSKMKKNVVGAEMTNRLKGNSDWSETSRDVDNQSESSTDMAKVTNRKVRSRRSDRDRNAGPAQPYLRCDHCQFKTRSKQQAALHRARHDPGIVIYDCADCDKQFLDVAGLERHKSIHTDNPKLRHRCQHCDYKTGSLSRFQIHQSKHDSNIAIVKCQWCTKKFTDSEPLSRHKCTRMSGANLYCCPHCDYRTAHRVRHQVHLSRKHSAGIDVFPCPTCRRPFLSAELLARHRCKRAGAAAPCHPCDQCKFKTTCASQLRYHVLAVHSGEKPFKCQMDDCDYATGSKTCLKRHWAVQHLDIKKFICEACGHRCVTAQQLTNHKNTHVGLKPYRCDECGATFAHAFTWKRHVQRHVSDDRVHVCHMCGTAFNRRDNLRVHLKNVHKTELNPSSA